MTVSGFSTLVAGPRRHPPSPYTRRTVPPSRGGDAAARVVTAAGLPTGFIAQTLIAFTAIICLPRQFHVAVVECQDPADIRPARWLFGGYLNVFAVPITLAG